MSAAGPLPKRSLPLGGTAHSAKGAMTRARRIGIWVAVSTLLALVFASYLRPDVVMTLATQIWNCF